MQRKIVEENDKNWKNWRNTPIEYFVLGLIGESGEVANITKKYNRFLLGWKGNCLNKEEFIEKLKSELADVQIYLAIIAEKYGLDLERLVEEKQKVNRKRFGWKK